MIRQLIRKIMVGDYIPNINLPLVTQGKATPVNLEEFFRDKTAILVGHPGAFTRYTTQEQIPDYIKANFPHQVYLWSVNDPFVLKKYAEKYNIEFPMFGDFNGELARNFEVTLPEEEYLSLCCKRTVIIVKNSRILGVSSELTVHYTKATKPDKVNHLLNVIFNT